MATLTSLGSDTHSNSSGSTAKFVLKNRRERYGEQIHNWRFYVYTSMQDARCKILLQHSNVADSLA